MGSGLSFATDVESLAAPGQKSVLSDSIDKVTAEELLDGLESYVREGKMASGKESRFEVVEKSGYLVASSLFEIPALFGGGSVSTFSTYRFIKDTLEMESKFYRSDLQYRDDEATCTNMLKIHSNPVRIEFWSIFHEVRSCGLMVEKMMSAVLQKMGTAAKARTEAESPSEPGKLSVVSEPIEDVDVTPETFLAFFRRFIVDDNAGMGLPDGTIVEERSSLLDVLGVTTRSIAKHVFDEADNRVYIHEYGEDETLTDELAVTHVRVHTAPFRIEQYNVCRPGRRSGLIQTKLIKDFAEGALSHMSQKG